MPYLLIKTNQTLSAEAGQTLLAEASREVAGALGKPERYVMVALEQGCPMLFGGSAAPLTYLELKSIGLPEGRTGELSSLLAKLASKHLGVSQERVYIEFSNASGPMWGWNGATF